MPDTLRYDDWQISVRHHEIVNSTLPKGLRLEKLRRSIRGFENGRITDELQSGFHMMPLDSEVKRTFSSLHDVERRTLLIAAQSTTTTLANGTPPLMLVAESLRTKFAARRVTDLNGELYSTHSKPVYDVDDKVARRFDLLTLILSTRFREDR